MATVSIAVCADLSGLRLILTVLTLYALAATIALATMIELRGDQRGRHPDSDDDRC